MSNTNTGGPAFPGLDYIDQHGKKNPEGMTLRDYFAAKAMQAIVSHPNTGGMTYKDISDRAWVQADAMLKAREA
jgi:hypothetical protein